MKLLVCTYLYIPQIKLINFTYFFLTEIVHKTFQDVCDLSYVLSVEFLAFFSALEQHSLVRAERGLVWNKCWHCGSCRNKLDKNTVCKTLTATQGK